MNTAKEKEKKKSGPLKVILRILGGILAALLLLLLVMFVIPLTETGDSAAVPGSEDWMAGLDDGLRLDAITLPGTHDSGTGYVQLGFFSKCQSKTIGQQLEAGYRYLDIRLAVDGDGMKLKHGFTDCLRGPMPWSGALSLDAVLEQCYAFLDRHPTETAVFAVKQEHGSESAADFERLLDQIIQRSPEHWLLTDQIPTLGEARGKLVLFRRYEDQAGLGTQAGVPFLWKDQNGYSDVSLHTVAEENGSYTLWVQDRFEYNTEEKWAAFCAGLDSVKPGEDGIALHFLSTKGTAKFGHPYGFAKALNARLIQRQECSGWIVVDFASAVLAEHIYSANFH